MNRIRFFLRCKVSTLREQGGRPDRDGADPVRPYSGKVFPAVFSDPGCRLWEHPVWMYSVPWKPPAWSGSAASQYVSPPVHLQRMLLPVQSQQPESEAVSALQLQAQYLLPESALVRLSVRFP